ncbi:transcriptional regulator GcvA [Taklimakanibacter albus]|uniref:Transcriptional regulator GcvA n=1 Tax=Taklimakanibacter albus TaxID=2800327 RepID=A0ACC5RDG0_9HYPH|nr:transcriptional regulator GcvA [Aestuariivirga sp. YIM B02566]MBK1870634.1 transcriptional regulator GcvA [Aestuariivirga sp. YIM B02566]
MNRLPPLNALKAFEAAARHLSVKAAAEELSVTPGAVSQMLKTLELHLGRQLFDRVNRGIVLTEAGRNYLPPVRNAFRQIAEASRRVAAEEETGVLTVSTTPFFASAWLVPRLGSFRAAHPDIDLRILTGNGLADFTRDGVDVAIRHGLGRYPGLKSDHVLAVAMIPVAAPDLVTRLGKPANPAELLDWPLVQDADRKGWALWFEAQGLTESGPTRGPSFDDPGLLLSAIIAGQGAGLLPDAMVETDVKEGRLVRLAEPKEIEVFAYYLVYPELAQGRAKIQAFRDWILGEE